MFFRVVSTDGNLNTRNKLAEFILKYIGPDANVDVADRKITSLVDFIRDTVTEEITDLKERIQISDHIPVEDSHFELPDFIHTVRTSARGHGNYLSEVYGLFIRYNYCL